MFKCSQSVENQWQLRVQGPRSNPSIERKFGMRKKPKPCHPQSIPPRRHRLPEERCLCFHLKEGVRTQPHKATATLRTPGGLSPISVDTSRRVPRMGQDVVSTVTQVRGARVRSWHIGRVGGGDEAVHSLFNRVYLFSIQGEGRLAPQREGSEE